jgi:hypothetical protein
MLQGDPATPAGVRRNVYIYLLMLTSNSNPPPRRRLVTPISRRRCMRLLHSHQPRLFTPPHNHRRRQAQAIQPAPEVLPLLDQSSNSRS